MSEMTSVVETHQQHQQYVGDNSNARHRCKECGVNFDSETSLKVHLQYHEKNLLNQWANKTQQEESNNNHSKTGNHNSHVNVNRDSVTILADSSEPSAMSPSQDTTSSQQQQPQQQQQQQQQQQPQQQQSAIQLVPSYDHYQSPMFNESNYYINEQPYIISHHFSPSQEDAQNNRDSNGAYSRYHPYQHQQICTTSNSTSPQSPPLQCDKCGAVFEDTNQLGEHMRANHLESPSAYPPAPQYGSHLGHSPQQLHPSPPLPNQPQQQPGYDYNGGQTNKMDMKQEPEEQAEILDLDSHKVQTHRYEEEYLRMQQQQQHQQQQGLQMQIPHRLMQHQQQQHRIGSHSVSSMLAGNHSWLATQSHDYHPGLGSMGPVDNVPSSIPDQGQFMRSQHMPVEHGHQNSPIITSTQPMTGHQMPAGFAQQSSKAPPLANQSWKSNEARRPKTYNCTACNKWFTSSGHLKRHYNTTLHKNAVKNGKEPDPATLPISNHHHPTRENSNNSSSRGGGAPTRSTPDLPSSRSPPNLMAGPLGEATRGLLHTPTTHCNSSNNSSAVVLVQQPVVHLMHSGVMPITSPVPSSLAGHHQQPMGSAPHQLGLQQQRQLHLRTNSPGQSVHHTTSSPIPPQAVLHMNCPSPMDSSHQHHMNSLQGSVHPAMTSPTAMGDTTMPPQPYPNALPPHVTIITHQVLDTQLPTLQLPTTMVGNEQQQFNTLPSFNVFDQKTANYTPAVGIVNEHLQNPINTNVGGPTMEFTPQESFESSSTNYDPYSSNKLSSNVEVVTNIEQSAVSYQFVFEQNNNYLYQLEQVKEDTDPNINSQPKRGRKRKLNPSKDSQVTTTKAKFISKEGVPCIQCGKIFQKPCYLTQHNKSSHSGEKPFKCKKCGKRYSDKEMYDKHVKIHEQEKKHGCEICPKRFAHKTDLKRHVYTHKAERPFKCITCTKGFIRNDHMKKHALIHDKEKKRPAKKQKTTTSLFNSKQAGESNDVPIKY